MSISSSSAERTCGLPGSDSMEDWSSLSYLFCCEWKDLEGLLYMSWGCHRLSELFEERPMVGRAF